MKGLAIGGVLALLASSGAGAQSQSTADEAVIKLVVYKMVACIRKTIAEIDDGVTDASTIGRLALRPCWKAAGVDAARFPGAPGLSGIGVGYPDGYNTDMAIQAVLEHRRGKARN